ncbi:DNA-binding transcriptional regulator Fis [Halomonas ventosae]|uniref:Putative Fis-like DNA-binding protein n=1 Tax=Halomonas ventosae TaxID=229007 RepID=A0A4R6I3L5_9GAMM|nr:DNA-binding transcriptional regulator Fis [Halomonas ventosae]TDO16573.1 Fis family transcriptional regulator [Halomonas ventosae]
MTSRQSFDQNTVQPEREARSSPDLDLLSEGARSEIAVERPLREAVEASLIRYFDHLDGSSASDLYAMVMAEVEAPLLAAVLKHAQGNQTRAAEMLGLNRGTLRKKLKLYGLI